MHSIAEPIRHLVNSKYFQWFIICVILLAGIVVGLETDAGFVSKHKDTLHFLDELILLIFVVEILLKWIALTPKPHHYFLDPWNIFDFVIVAVCLLPLDSSFVSVIRLARVMRVFRLVSALPELQVIVGALLRSIPSMAYVGVLLGLFFYIYACIAVMVFGANDPIHFANLKIGVLSLFRVVTLEDWTDIMYIAMYGCQNYGYSGADLALCTQSQARPLAGALFFSSFVMFGTMIILNLFIGVIMNGMDEARKDHEAQELMRQDTDTIEAQLKILQKKFDECQQQLHVISSIGLAKEHRKHDSTQRRD